MDDRSTTTSLGVCKCGGALDPNADTLHSTIMCAGCYDRLVPHDEGPYPYSELRKPGWRKPRRLYHGTCSSVADAIMSEGAYRKGTFFAYDFDRAAAYATGEAAAWCGGRDCGDENCEPVVTSAVVVAGRVGLCPVEGDPVSREPIPLRDFRVDAVPGG